MDEFMEMDDTRSIIKSKLRQYFDGKIVRKDLTKHIKEGANVVLYSEDRKKRFMKHSLDVKNLYTLCNGILEKSYKNKVLYIISVPHP